MNSEKGLSFHSVENPQIGSSFLRLHKSSVFRPVILTLYTIMLSLTISGLLPTTTVADGKACVRETEYEVCSKGEICSYGQCVTGCRTTAQCPQGQGCLDNKCTTMISHLDTHNPVTKGKPENPLEFAVRESRSALAMVVLSHHVLTRCSRNKKSVIERTTIVMEA